jgi:phage FluMu gp28-like protein
VKEFGEFKPEDHKFGKIELCNFTNKLKVDIFPKLRMEFEGKRLAIPVSRTIREDLHSVNRVALAGGGVTYRAPHTDDGHADRCTALALAVRAAGTGTAGALTAETVGRIRLGGNGARRGFQPRRLRA